MRVADTAEGSQLAWVCSGCHARYDTAQECCAGEEVARHDLSQPCEDCALPEIVDDDEE